MRKLKMPRNVRIEETVDGRYMVLVNGFQWGGTYDASGAGNATFATALEALQAYRADQLTERRAITDTITYDVHEGSPSWHQQRAWIISAAVTTGFKTREEAEEFAAKLRAHHPNMRVFITERRVKA